MNKLMVFVCILIAFGLGAALAVWKSPDELAEQPDLGIEGSAPGGMDGYPRGSTTAFAQRASGMAHSLEPSPEEKQAIDEALSEKIQARERLSRESFALFQVAMDPTTSDEQITEAINRFLDTKRDLQNRIQEIDDELVENVSTRTRAKLLTSGVLDNGLSFMGGGSFSLKGGRPSPSGR